MQGAGLIRWGRISHAVLGLDRQHLVTGAIELGHDLLDLALLRELELLLPPLADQAGGKHPLRQIDLRQHCIESPGFNRDKALDFFIPLADQPDCHRLHPAGAQAFPNLFPEQRA